MLLYNYHIEFLTATILNWKHLLKDDAYKQVIVDSLQWLTEQARCTIHGFVIMPNHIHLLWRISNLHDRFNVQGALLSYTAHRFKTVAKEDGKLFKHFVADKDRLFQFWERDSLVKECWNETFLLQKLNYIHHNPCQPHWKLAATPEDYKWSSARFYHTGVSEFGWLKHYAG
ncbi:transposase [Flavisolibacter ginsenosidimutans]|uniref:transposase n=1 Tax=Flavisolibacter ginsenosidimutans TaxID=661481 RepID=UPI00155A24DE|nr:transposase [Flavisolibacter ginsenosidimutans]